MNLDDTHRRARLVDAIRACADLTPERYADVYEIGRILAADFTSTRAARDEIMLALAPFAPFFHAREEEESEPTFVSTRVQWLRALHKVQRATAAEIVYGAVLTTTKKRDTLVKKLANLARDLLRRGGKPTELALYCLAEADTGRRDPSVVPIQRVRALPRAPGKPRSAYDIVHRNVCVPELRRANTVNALATVAANILNAGGTPTALGRECLDEVQARVKREKPAAATAATAAETWSAAPAHRVLSDDFVDFDDLSYDDDWP